MVALLLLMSLAAARPPERPLAPEALQGDCAEPLVFEPGKPVPAEMLDAEGNLVCGGQLLPSHQVVHYINLAAWGDALHNTYTLDEAAWKYKLDQAHTRIAQLESPPWHERPGNAQLIGASKAVAGVVAGAVLVSVITKP